MSATRTTVIAGTVLVLTFLAGIAVGVFGAHLMILHRRGGPGRAQPFAAHMMINRLDRQLDLTDTQRTQIQAILQRRHQRMMRLWTEVRPRLGQEIEQTNADIARVLTPEQRVKFEKVKITLEGAGPHGGGPHGGGPHGGMHPPPP